ncbi:MAG: glutaredoxin domain-containing protein, partial [Oxalobacteraceae bacterium]
AADAIPAKEPMKTFFRLLRLILGPVMLLKERLTRPPGVVRAAPEQARVDAACQKLTLYQFSTCPFCIKVRQEMRRLSLNVALRDAQHSAENRQVLLAQGGSSKVPCLKITNQHGNAKWLYDSGEIIGYLQQQFALGK